MVEAFGASGIMTWPPDDEPETQAAFDEIEDEILAETFVVVKEQIAEAFVAAANRVFARERRRPVLTPKGR